MIKFAAVSGFLPLKGQVIYRTAEYSFDFSPEPRSEGSNRFGCKGTTSVLIGTLGIEFALETRLALYVRGYHPRPSWREARLPSISPHPGGIKVLLDEEPREGVGLQLAAPAAWHTIYDQESGWVCVCENHPGAADDYVLFADGTAAGLSKDRLSSLWLHPIIQS